MARIFGSSDVVPPERSNWTVNLEKTKSTGNDGKWGVDVGSGPRSLKVTCLSDTHGHYRGMEDIIAGSDLLLLAGDMLDHTQKDAASLADLNDWIAHLGLKKSQIVYVAGNHDKALCHAGSTFAKRVDALPHVTYLEGGMTTVADGAVSVAGGPWVLGRPFYFQAQTFAVSGSSLVDKWSELAGLVLSMNPKTSVVPAGDPAATTTTTESAAASDPADASYLDILVTHGPPEGVFDIDYKRRRTGTVALRDCLVARARPLVHVFGHNHDKNGVVWGTLHYKGTERDSDDKDADHSDHRMLFVGAAATFTHKCQYFTLHY